MSIAALKCTRPLQRIALVLVLLTLERFAIPEGTDFVHIQAEYTGPTHAGHSEIAFGQEFNVLRANIDLLRRETASNTIEVAMTPTPDLAP